MDALARLRWPRPAARIGAWVLAASAAPCLAQAPAGAGPCADTQGILARSAFVIVTRPAAGQAVAPSFAVEGCSRTFESEVSWRLVARDGHELASGTARGGGADGPAAFGFEVAAGETDAQLVHLEVFEVDASDGEGFPPGRTVLPLLLRGSPPATAATAPAEPAPEADAGAPAPTWEEAASATYSGIYDEPVALRAGRHEGPPFVDGGASRPTLALVPDLLLAADLDARPGKEAVVLLAESSGGSGSRVYVAALGRVDGETRNLGTALVGDRPQVRALEGGDGMIRLSLVEQGPEDAACCPGQLATRYWMLRGDRLVEVASEAGGRLSLALIEGEAWSLAGTGVTFAVAGQRIGGTAGCNEYFAEVREPAPGQLEIGPVGVTRRMCPEALMDVEHSYLERLGGVRSYGFLNGKLALTWVVGKDTGTMVFER